LLETLNKIYGYSVMDLDFNIELFTYALEKSRENDLWEMWKLQFPGWDKESYISFEDYKAKFMFKKHTTISYEDIEKEMDRVVKSYEEGR
jgi:hypothetical protein